MTQAREGNWATDCSVAVRWYKQTQGPDKERYAYQALRASAFAGGLIRVGYVVRDGGGSIRPLEVAVGKSLRRPAWADPARKQIYVRLTEAGRLLLHRTQI